jgi:mandelamide amidase
VTALLRQYEAHKDLNVANTIFPERVKEAARAVDVARARGQLAGRAAGLPLGIKDQMEVAGYPTSGGNGALRGYIPRQNAPVVDRLLSAGAIPFAMTACPDMTVIDGLMHQASSHSDDFGAVHNPYDRTRIPGGSSGGSGAILAARIVPAALGEDTNGSIRLPSAFCGVCGLRPSTRTLEAALTGEKRKRYSDTGLLMPPLGRLDTIGPMARTVEDVAFLDEVVTNEPLPTIDRREIRIAIPRPDFWDQDFLDPGVAQVMQEAFARLRDAGIQLVEIDFEGEVRSIVGTIMRPTLATTVAGGGLGAPPPVATREALINWLREHAPDVTVEQMYRGRREYSGTINLPSVEEQRAAVTEAQQRYRNVYESHDVMAIAYPTVPIPATPIVAGGPKEPLGEMITVKGKQIEEGKLLIHNIFIAPRVGAPGLVMPAGMTRGLPVGMEMDALPGNDRQLLAIGIAVQAVIGRIPAPR